MTLKALIVDDESASRETLKSYLEKYCTGIQTLATADSVKSALIEIDRHHPDVVFLDIEMPFGNAFDLLEQVPNIEFETVFVTAYSNYAIQAINISASYYILKPINIDELVIAVEKIKTAKQKKATVLHSQILMDNIQTSNKQLQKVVLPVLDGFEVVQIKDIVRCEAQDNFTDFFFTNGKHLLICRTLKFYEQALSDFGFMRVHKSHLVNIQYVKKYRKGKGGQLVMVDDSEIEVSPTRKEELLQKFKEG